MPTRRITASSLGKIPSTLVLLFTSLLSLCSGLFEPPQAHPNLQTLASLCRGQFRLPGTYAVEEFSMDAWR